jgi:hypothetical protein
MERISARIEASKSRRADVAAGTRCGSTSEASWTGERARGNGKEAGSSR